MSYQVLARKFRPQTWDDLLAQEHVTTTLRTALETGRIAHAYLFSGPRGVGKTSAARILAKALNCEKGPVPDPCNSCSACTEISQGRHVDVIEIDGASNNGVDEVRNLRENVRYAPTGGKSKVYIIDEVHMLTVQAFNALLKTLEEPPDNVLFIFATTEPHKIPPTIISRCQRFDFRRIPVSVIVDNLEKICASENIDVDRDALEIIAIKGDGSMRDSQSLLDQMISYHKDRITAEHVVRGLGLISRDVYFDLTSAIADNDMARGFTLIEDVIKNGYDVGEFISGLLEHFRNVLIAGSAGEKGLVDVPETSRGAYMAEKEKFSHGDIFRLLNIADSVQQQIKKHAQKRVLLEIAVAKMVTLDRTVTIDEILSRLGSSGQSIPSDMEHKQSRPAAVSEKKSYSYMQDTPAVKQQPVKKKEYPAEKKSIENRENPKSAPPVVSSEHIASKWPDIIEALKRRTITVGSFLQDGAVSKVNGNNIEIEFHESNWFHIDSIQRSRSVVDEVISSVLGQKVTFTCVKTDKKDLKYGGGEASKEDKLSEMAQSDPVVRSIVDEFDTDVMK